MIVVAMLLVAALIVLIVFAALVVAVLYIARDDTFDHACEECDYWENRLWKGYCYHWEEKRSGCEKCCESFKFKQ